jgi:hypothetical protein
VLRGLTVVDGRLVGVGSSQSGATVRASAHWFASDGAASWSDWQQPGGNSYMLAALPDASGFWSIGYWMVGPDQLQPLLLHYAGDGSGFALDWSSADVGVLADIEGQLFDADVAPSGDLVIVGSFQTGTSHDAGVLLVSAGGDLVDGPVLVGEGYEDGFVEVDVADDGSVVAVGNIGTGPTAWDMLIARFTVEGSIQPGPTTTWGDAAFTHANGFARDGDALFVALGTSDDPNLSAASFETSILRWDGDATEPTWTVPFADDSPNRDYGSDVELAADGTIVACGVMTPAGTENGPAWVRKIVR